MDENNLPENPIPQLDPNKIPEDLIPKADNTKKGPDRVKLIVATIIFMGSIIFALTRIINSAQVTVPIYTPKASDNGAEYMEGSIKYVTPYMAPEEDISYRLIDAKGEHITYLKSDDEKLELAEGLYVKVKGSSKKTDNGEDVLFVDEVIVSR